MDDTRYRFYAHVWTKADGHADRRYLMNGPDVLTAQSRLLRKLAERDPEILVHLKAVETVR
jgi:hypothetical protein